MPHRLQTQAIAELSAPVRVRPRLADQDGVLVRGVARAGQGLVFRAEGGGLRPGIYEEPEGGEARLLAADSDAAVLLEPQVAGEWVLLKRAPRAGAPSWVTEIVVAHKDGEAAVVPGQEVSVDDRGHAAVVVDAAGGALYAVDLVGAAPVAEKILDLSGLDPQRAPVPSWSPDGRRVLAAVGPGSEVMELDLGAGTTRSRLGPLPGPGWRVAGAGADGTLVVLEEAQTGDGPRAQLLRVTPRGETHRLFSASLSQPMVVPLIQGSVVLAALTLEPFGVASYGPVHLVALPLAAGAQARWAELPAGPLRLKPRGGEIHVEGASELWVLRGPGRA